ncbi:hypothetical protein OQA88_6355 [Cercophora sp. LCS_1]
MGGALWKKEEEKIFWKHIVPFCKQRLPEHECYGPVVPWSELAIKMQRLAGHILVGRKNEPRDYTETCLSEHLFQNINKNSPSPSDTVWVHEFANESMRHGINQTGTGFKATKSGTRKNTVARKGEPMLMSDCNLEDPEEKKLYFETLKKITPTQEVIDSPLHSNGRVSLLHQPQLRALAELRAKNGLPKLFPGYGTVGKNDRQDLNAVRLAAGLPPVPTAPTPEERRVRDIRSRVTRLRARRNANNRDATSSQDALFGDDEADGQADAEVADDDERSDDMPHGAVSNNDGSLMDDTTYYDGTNSDCHGDIMYAQAVTSAPDIPCLAGYRGPCSPIKNRMGLENLVEQPEPDNMGNRGNMVGYGFGTDVEPTGPYGGQNLPWILPDPGQPSSTNTMPIQKMLIENNNPGPLDPRLDRMNPAPYGNMDGFTPPAYNQHLAPMQPDAPMGMSELTPLPLAAGNQSESHMATPAESMSRASARARMNMSNLVQMPSATAYTLPIRAASGFAGMGGNSDEYVKRHGDHRGDDDDDDDGLFVDDEYNSYF